MTVLALFCLAKGDMEKAKEYYKKGLAIMSNLETEEKLNKFSCMLPGLNWRVI
jgi:hypothetical protein